MSTPFRPGTDFLDVVDGLEPVRVRHPGAAEERLVARSKRRAVQVGEAAPSGGQYLAGDVHWHLHRDELSAPPPLGARIVDGRGLSWTVLAVDQMAHDHRWRCHCRCLQISAGLDASVNIQVAVWTKDSAGARLAQWSDWQSGLPARLQPAAAETTIQDRRATTNSSHVAIVDLEQPLDELGNYRLLGPDGRAYEIVGLEQTERIDRLPTLLLRRLMAVAVAEPELE